MVGLSEREELEGRLSAGAGGDELLGDEFLPKGLGGRAKPAADDAGEELLRCEVIREAAASTLVERGAYFQVTSPSAARDRLRDTGRVEGWWPAGTPSEGGNKQIVGSRKSSTNRW